MTALEVGFLLGLILVTGLYAWLLRRFHQVYMQQLAQADQLATWQQSLRELSDSLREDERVKMVEAVLDGEKQ